MSPAQIYGGYMTGLSPVHGRYIDRLCRIQSLTGDIGKPAVRRRRSRQRGCVGLPSPRQRRVLGQRLDSSLYAMGMVPNRQPAPAAGTNKASTPPSASRTATNGTGRPGCPAHQSDEQSRRPDNGTKRAQIGKASGYTHRSFGPDAVRYMSVTIATPCPTAAHDDTWRDKKETARRAAFPQPGGRFRRWWQVLGSNQRRLSRRFYSPSLLPEAHATDQHICVPRCDSGLRPSAMRPWASGLVHGRERKKPRTGAVGAVTPTVRPASCL